MVRRPRRSPRSRRAAGVGRSTPVPSLVLEEHSEPRAFRLLERRGRDSNPRALRAGQLLSRQLHSSTLPPLQSWMPQPSRSVLREIGFGAMAQRVAELDRRPALRAGRGRAAPHPRGADLRRQARGGARPADPRRRLGALLHRGGADRRRDDPDRGAQAACSTPTRLRPGQGRGGDRARRPQRGAVGAGLAMENLGDIDRQTLAGAISTGTHGTGAELRNLSAQVEAIELVLADGSVLESPSATDPERVRAARVGLGALGVDLRGDARARPRLHPAPGRRAAAARGDPGEPRRAAPTRNDHFEFFVFPYTDTALVLERNRTDAPPTPAGPRSAPTSTRSCSRTTRWTCCRGSGAAFPPTIPRLVGFAADQFSHTEKTRPQLPGLRLRAPRPVHRDGVRDPAPARAGGGAPGARVVRERRLPVGFPIEMRLVAADDALLSPAHERETAYIAVHQYQGVAWEPYFQAVEADHVRVRRPPALGQAPLPDGGDAGAALSALARLPAGPRAARPAAGVSATPTRTASWARSARPDPPGP